MDNVTNKIINGGFETGDFTGWSVLSESDSSGSFYIQSGTDSPVSRFPVPSPSEGSYAAMTDQYGPTSSVLFQNISLEAGLVHTLNFDYFVGNRADAFYTPDSMSVSTRSNQQFRVDILNPTFSNFFGTATEGVLANVFQTVVGSTQVFSNYQPLTFDLTSFAGSSVNLAFRMVDNVFFFQAGVDNVAVNSVNVAPVLSDTSVTLDSLNEDSGVPVGAVGTLVSQLVDIVEGAGQNNVTDAAPGAVTGIAITSANTTNGTWFYSINNGAIWNALGEVSDSNARLLAADPNTRIYFQSNDNFNGTIDNAIQFRAWDQITGINGNTADTSINGGSTSFSAATDTASITVNGVNDAPTLTGTPATFVNGIEDTVYTISQTDLLTGFTDVDGDTLSISNLTASNGTLVDNNDGTWSFTGDTNYNGTINLSYNVTDGQGGSTEASQSFTLAAVNDAPTLTQTQATLVNGTEETIYTISQTDLLAGFTDVDGDTLSISNLTASNGTLVDNNDGTWSFTGDTNYNGTINLSYNVTDGQGGSTEASQSFTLAAVNDAPTLTQTQATLVNGTEETVYTISQTDLLTGFTDVDGDTLSISNLTANNGILVDNNGGTWSFTGDTNYNGSVNLNYNVTDGQGGSTEATQSFTLAAVNDAPTLTGTPATLVNGTEDTVYTISQTDLLAGFTDVDGDTLSISNLTTSNGSLVDNNDGTWSFTGDTNYNGSVNLSYNVTDGNGGSTEASQSFTLAAVNDAPTLTQTQATLVNGTEETIYTISQTDLLTGFTDVDGDTLSISNLTASNGTLVDNNDGTWSFTGAANYNGSVNLNYNVTDGQGGSTEATQSFTLATVNALNGSSVSETLVGTDKSDRINGLGGHDMISGGFGSDRIYGGAGNDQIIGDITNLVGSEGDAGMDDIIYGGKGNEQIWGCGGNDSLYGDRGNDQIWGGAGDDLISGGRGNDILMGGAGSDIFVFGKGSGTDTIRDFQMGQDYIAVKGTLTLEDLSITQVGSQTLISDTSHNKTIALLSGVNAAELVAHASSTFFTI